MCESLSVSCEQTTLSESLPVFLSCVCLHLASPTGQLLLGLVPLPSSASAASALPAVLSRALTCLMFVLLTTTFSSALAVDARVSSSTLQLMGRTGSHPYSGVLLHWQHLAQQPPSQQHVLQPQSRSAMLCDSVYTASCLVSCCSCWAVKVCQGGGLQ